MKDSRLIRTSGLMVALASLLMGIATPSLAHKEHNKKRQEAAQVEPASGRPLADERVEAGTGPVQVQAVPVVQEPDEDRSSMSTLERLLDWVGRLHPIIVHFPIAFFPAALFCAILGRRRPMLAAPVQFLVIAAGIIAPIAAILGWLDAMAADPDPLLTAHRWLGTLIAVCALTLACWAWRRPDRGGSAAMILVLSLITSAIVVQGWLGGALVHGADHLSW